MVNNPRGMSHNARKTNPLYLESGSGYPLSEYYSDKPLTEAQKFNLMQRLESDGTEIISDWEAQRLENLEMGEGDENGITEDMKGLSKSTNMYKMSYVKPKFKTILAQPRGGSIRFMAKGGATESCSKCGGEGEIEIKNNFDDGRGDYVWEDCDECDDAKGGETTSWGGVRGRLNIPQLSFSKVDYDVNVNPKNLEVDVNIKASDSVNHYDLNDTDANWEQHTWGYMVYPKSEKQLYDVLKAL